MAPVYCSPVIHTYKKVITKCTTNFNIFIFSFHKIKTVAVFPGKNTRKKISLLLPLLFTFVSLAAWYVLHASCPDAEIANCGICDVTP